VIAVVIPTLNPGCRFGEALVALAPGAVEGLVKDVVVADAGSTDRTLELAEAAGCRVVTTEKGRGAQLIAGAAAAKGEWLLFLHADTVLKLGWVEAVGRQMERQPDKAGYFRLRFDDPSTTARLWEQAVAARCALFGLPYGDQGLLISRALYDEAGGYPDWPLMEDVELVRRIGPRRLARIDAVAETDAEKFRRDGWIRRSARNVRFLLAWKFGADPRGLAQRYG